MGFDWESFFRSENIQYLTAGKNVKNGNVNANCPFCGSADTGFHFGCDPVTSYWGCWRNPEHRGKNPAKVVQKIKGCTWAEALAIVGSDDAAPAGDSLADLERILVTHDDLVHRIIEYPSDFRTIEPTGVTAIAFRHLQLERDYPLQDVRPLCAYYKIRYAVFGQFKGRIILPFLHERDAILGWSSRAVGQSQLRYISYPKAAADKRLLFNYGKVLQGGKVLIIVEGGFGAIRLDFYGKAMGIRTVATLGSGYTEAQVALIFKLAPKFERVFVLFDPGAEAQSFQLSAQLAAFGAESLFLTPGLDGPDEIEYGDVVPFLKELL